MYSTFINQRRYYRERALFGFLRVIASFSLVSWCGKQAMRMPVREQQVSQAEILENGLTVSSVRECAGFYIIIFIVKQIFVHMS